MTERDRRNIDAVRRFYEAERASAAPDITWCVPGHTVSGEYRGQQAYVEVMPARMAPLDAWEIGVLNCMVDSDVVVATYTLHGARRGLTVDLSGCHLLPINDAGHVAEGWGFTDGQEALDAFFAA
jgi:ketosteroid isomerase-like protein